MGIGRAFVRNARRSASVWGGERGWSVRVDSARWRSLPCLAEQRGCARPEGLHDQAAGSTVGLCAGNGWAVDFDTSVLPWHRLARAWTETNKTAVQAKNRECSLSNCSLAENWNVCWSIFFISDRTEEQARREQLRPGLHQRRASANSDASRCS